MDGYGISDQLQSNYSSLILLNMTWMLNIDAYVRMKMIVQNMWAENDFSLFENIDIWQIVYTNNNQTVKLNLEC